MNSMISRRACLSRLLAVVTALCVTWFSMRDASAAIDKAGSTWAAGTASIAVTGEAAKATAMVCIFRDINGVLTPVGTGRVVLDGTGAGKVTVKPFKGRTFQAGDVAYQGILGDTATHDSATLVAGGTFNAGGATCGVGDAGACPTCAGAFDVPALSVGWLGAFLVLLGGLGLSMMRSRYSALTAS